jgi:hypothetical protein
MNAALLKRRLWLLYLLVILQRTTRNSIRSVWLGAAVYLCAWGVNELTGMYPNEQNWIMLGMAVGILSMINIFFPWPRLWKLTWVMDRRLGLREQMTAAIQAVNSKTNSQVAESLFSDVNHKIPRLTIQIAWRGWF